MAQVEVLLQELEALPHASRIKRMVELGRSSLTEPSSGALLHALQSQQGVVSQSLACYACYGTRDGSVCRDILLTSGSKTLKGLAMTVLLDIIPDEQVPQVLMPLTANPAHPGQLLHILHRLRKQGRHAATAHFVHAVACLVDPTAEVSGMGPHGVPEISHIDLEHKSEIQLRLLADLLPFGNPQQVSLMLKPLLKKCDLRLAAQHHSQLMIDTLIAMPPSERSQSLTSCLDSLMQQAPEQVYMLFDSLPAEHVSLTLLARLYKRFPERMLQHFMQMQSDNQAQHLQLWLARAARKQAWPQQQQGSAAASLPQRQLSAISTASSWAVVPCEPDHLEGTAAGSSLELLPEAETDHDHVVQAAGDAASAAPKVDSNQIAAAIKADHDLVAQAAGDNEGTTDATVPEHSVYSMLARKPLYGMTVSPHWANFRCAMKPRDKDLGVVTKLAMCRVRELKRMPMQPILQVCLLKFSVAPRVLRSMPMSRREEFYNTWKAWWLRQCAGLHQMQQRLEDMGQSAAAATHIKKLWETSQNMAACVWPASDYGKQAAHVVGKLLPASCLEDLVRVLLSEFGYDPRTTTPPWSALSVLRAAVPYLEPAALHKLLKDYPQLWNRVSSLQDADAAAAAAATAAAAAECEERDPYDSGSDGNNNSDGEEDDEDEDGEEDEPYPLFNDIGLKLPPQLHADLLLSHPNIESARMQHSIWAAAKPRQEALAGMLPSFQEHWEAGCKAAALGYNSATTVTTAMTPVRTDSIGSQLQMLHTVSKAAQQHLLGTLLDSMPSEGVQAVLEQTCRTNVNPFVACSDVYANLLLARPTLEVMYHHWQSVIAAPEHDVEHLCGSTLTSLAALRDSPQHLKYQAVKATLQIMKDNQLYAPWLQHTRSRMGSYPMPVRIHDIDTGHSLTTPRVLMWALSPAHRQALLLHAARSALALCPAVATDIKVAQHLGSGRVLQQLREYPQYMLQGWTAEGAKQLLELMPGLLYQVPMLLVYMDTSDVLQQLRAWHAKRQALEQCMIPMLGGADASNGAASSAILGPAAIQAVSPSIRSMLAIQSDPLLQQLIGKDQLLPRLMAAAGQGSRGTLCQAVFDMVRPVIWHEWQNNPSGVHMKLLPPTERAVLARASIMEVTAQHKGALSALFDKAKHLIPYLPYSEIMELPCFKEKLQARDAETRAQAMEYLVLAIPTNPDLLKSVLQLLHVRRREPDDIRRRVLSALSSSTVLGALVQHATRAAIQELAAEHAVAMAQQYIPAKLASQAELVQQAAEQYRATVRDLNLNKAGPDDSWQLEALKSSLPSLAQFIKDCAASHDLSSTSSGLVADMILMLLPSEPTWAVQQLVTLMSHTGLQAVSIQKLETAAHKHIKDLESEGIWPHAWQVAADAGQEADSEIPIRQHMKALDPARRTTRGRRRHGVVQFNTSRILNVSGMHRLRASLKGDACRRAPRERNQVARWLLPELWLQQFISQTLPALIQAVSPRQDGLACTLQLLKVAWQQAPALFKQIRASCWKWPLVHPETVRTLQAAVKQLVTTTPILTRIASLPHPGALPTCTPNESVKLVAWYADKVLLYMPDEYVKLLHLMFPADVRHYEVLKPRLLNTLQDSLPKDRYDLLLPFLSNNKHLPELATKAVTYLFKYHPDKVSETIPQLLAADPSYIMIPRMFWYCLNHHQQLIPALDVQDNSSKTTDATFTTGNTAPAAGGEDVAQKTPTLLFIKGASGNSLRSGISSYSIPKLDRTSTTKRIARIKFNYSGWSRQGLHTSLWLGLPQLSLRTAYKLSTSQQEAIGKVLTAAFKTKGKLDVTVVRGLANRLAALPALPSSCLLDLLKTANSGTSAEGTPGTNTAAKAYAAQQMVNMPSAPGQGTNDQGELLQPAAAAGNGRDAGTAEGAATTASNGGSQAVHDVVLASLVKLDDMSQAWSSLITALRNGGSSTALAAISALLAADIRALTSAQAEVTGTPATSVSESGAAVALLQKMRQLPWTRPAVMCEVIKLLGQLSEKSPAALNELIIIADYAAAGLKRVGTTGKEATAATAQVAAAAIASVGVELSGSGQGVGEGGKASGSGERGKAGSLPPPAGKPLHRSPHIQLLKTFQAFYAHDKVKTAFLVATTAEDKEIASAAAFIPDEALQRITPDVIPTCVEVFSSLIKHPDQLVRLHAINTWSDSPSIIPLDSALSLVQQVTSWINTAKAPADEITQEEKERLAHEADKFKEALQRWFNRLL